VNADPDSSLKWWVNDLNLADDDAFIGPENAKVTIVEFSEFECYYCQRFHKQTLPLILRDFGMQVKFVYRDFPLNMHGLSQKAAEATECAEEQGRNWEMNDLLFEHWNELSLELIKSFATQLGLNEPVFNACLDSSKYEGEVLKDRRDALALGVYGLPWFFINDQIIVGALPYSEFRKVIIEELNEVSLNNSPARIMSKWSPDFFDHLRKQKQRIIPPQWPQDFQELNDPVFLIPH
ncbi:MAG: thioredoxin domain-containing protein, partial [archaeon]